MKKFRHSNEEIRNRIKKIRESYKYDSVKAKKMEDELIIELDYLVRAAIHKYKNFDNYQDLFQEGIIGLIKSIQKYDTNTTFHFFRYSNWWIKARVMRSIKKLNLITVSGDEKMRYFMQYDIKENDVIEDNNPEKTAILTQEISNLHININSLPEKHQQVIKMRYGLNCDKKYNLQDLGDKLNMTREGLRQLEHRILNKLKNNNTFNE